MKILLTYYYPENGLQAGEGVYDSAYGHPERDRAAIKAEILKMQKEGKLPGRSSRTITFIILVDFASGKKSDSFLILPANHGGVHFHGDDAHDNITITGHIGGDVHLGDKKTPRR